MKRDRHVGSSSKTYLVEAGWKNINLKSYKVVRDNKISPNVIYKAQFCLCVYLSVCLDSFETAWRTNIKFGPIDHLFGVSVIKAS